MLFWIEISNVAPGVCGSHFSKIETTVPSAPIITENTLASTCHVFFSSDPSIPLTFYFLSNFLLTSPSLIIIIISPVLVPDFCIYTRYMYILYIYIQEFVLIVISWRFHDVFSNGNAFPAKWAAIQPFGNFA